MHVRHCEGLVAKSVIIAGGVVWNPKPGSAIGLTGLVEQYVNCINILLNLVIDEPLVCPT